MSTFEKRSPRAYTVEYDHDEYLIPIKNEYNTVGQLAQEIKKRFDMPPDISVRLRYMGAILDEDDSLYDLQIDTTKSPIRVCGQMIKNLGSVTMFANVLKFS